MLTEKQFDTGEAMINYAEGDTDGPPLLVLHGATVNWQTMGDIFPSLEKHWHLYAPDFRGHGKSGWRTTGYRLVDYVPDVTLFIERIIGQPTVVVGFSLGAKVAMQVPARLPKLTRAIVLLEPALILWDAGIRSLPETYEWVLQNHEILSSSRTPEERMAHIKRLMPDLDEAGLQFHVDRINGLDPAVLTPLLEDRLIDSFNLEEVLTKVACPAMLVYGEFATGGVVRDSDAALLKAYVPHARIFQVKGAPHWVFVSPFTSVVMEQVNDFLESV